MRVPRGTNLVLLLFLAVGGLLLAGCPGGQSDGGSADTGSSGGELAEAMRGDTCPVCGMPTGTSSTTVSAGDIVLDSLPCWVDYAETNQRELAGAEVLDYSTVSGGRETVPVADAHYVPVEQLKNSMEPYLPAFASEEEARKFAEQRDSEVIGFQAAVRRTRAYFEEHGRHSHPKSGPGGHGGMNHSGHGMDSGAERNDGMDHGENSGAQSGE